MTWIIHTTTHLIETWLVSDCYFVFFFYVENLWLIFSYLRSSEVHFRFVVTTSAESCESIVVWQHLGSWLLAQCWSTAAFVCRSPSACRWPLSRVWFVAGTGRLFLRLLLHRLWLLPVFLIELMLFCKMSEHIITRRECFLAHSTLRWLSCSIWHFNASWLLWFLFLDVKRGGGICLVYISRSMTCGGSCASARSTSTFLWSYNRWASFFNYLYQSSPSFDSRICSKA